MMKAMAMMTKTPRTTAITVVVVESLDPFGEVNVTVTELSEGF